jgi:hypothetical protein
MDKPPAQSGNYKAKEVDNWKWKDFYNYFDDSYNKTFGKSLWISNKQRNAKKSIIEKSFEHWGKEVFKAMIDWLFANYQDYPQWEDVGIGLICGSHYWAKMIAENAKKQLEVDKKWKS